MIVRKYVYGQILGLEMKKFVFFCMALLCFSACKTDLSEIEERIDEIERQGKNLEQQGKNLEQQGKDLENKSKDLEQQGQDLAGETERLQNDLDNTQNRIDEIEKAFAGFGNNDQGNDITVTRMVGYFLTWMQERKSLVYLVATANDLDSLRPELLRKGRWDEIFYLS